MISDPTELAEAKASWQGVEVLRGRLQRALLGAFAQGGTFAMFAADAAHNLPFVHAFGVLKDVLMQLEHEKWFQCKGTALGSLLDASEHKLPWTRFEIIKEGKGRRNQVAHDGEVLPRGECWKYIDAIKEQLLEWGVLETT